MRNVKPKLFAFAVAFLTVALLALPAQAQVKDHRDIEYPALPDFEIQKPEVYRLKNGMTVFLMEDHELPLISVTAQIRTGSNREPAVKTGLADIFAQVLREGGTASLSGDEIDDFLEARAASIETGMGGDVGSASMDCLAEDFDEVFRLFSDVLRNPVFAEDKIELAKVQETSSIARRNDNFGDIVRREFGRLIYGPDSPLGRLTEYATVTSIAREDLLAWHRKYYHPDKISIGVVGDFNSSSMKQKIRETFEAWPKGPELDEGEVPYRKQTPAGVYFIAKDDVTQANIRIGHLGIERKNPDYFAVRVMNEVLGGGFSGRLLRNVRSKKGLAYSVGGGIGASFLRPGVFQVGLSTKSSTMAESVEAVKQEIRGIIDDPPSDEEIKRAKETILNSFIFNYTSSAQILAQQMTFAYYGMPADYLDKYRGNIEKVTAADVARVARKYIHPDKLALLIVGKAGDFDRPPSDLGPVTEIDIAIPAPPDRTPQVEKTAQGLEVGSKRFAEVAAAMLGQAPQEMSSARVELQVTMSMGGQAMSLSQDVSYVLPDKLRQSVNTPMGQQLMVINGDNGYVSMGGQNRPLPGEQIADATRQLARDLLVLVSHHDDPQLEALPAGTEDVDGKTYELLLVTFRGAESRLFVDADGSVVRQTYQGKHPLHGTPGQVEIQFSDYRTVDGRRVPHQQVMRFEGQEVATLSIDAIDINPQLDMALFEIPDTD